MKKYVLTNIQRPSKEKINELAEFDVSTVYEAQGKIGLMTPYLRPIQQGRMICGPVVTAICYAGDNLMIHAAIEACQPNDILVITTIGESNSGMIGELIVEALMNRQVKGVIIDAGVRDVSRIRELGFPIWSKAIHSEGTTKTKAGWVNAPAICAGVTVNPGDVIMADDDGVVVVPKEHLDFAIESSRNRALKEVGTKERIARGELSLDFYNLREVLKNNGVEYIDTHEFIN